jgi:hypothetical protein
MTNLPPPPPLPSKGSRKTLIAAIVIVIIVVAAVAGAYVVTRPASSNPSPSPSASSGASSSPSATGTPSSSSSPSHTASPSSSASPTATPSGASPSPSGQSYAGFRAGAWAKYTIKAYDDAGILESENPMTYSIEDGTYNGVACWLLKMELQQGSGDETMKMEMTYWTDKSTLGGLHVKTKMAYLNGTTIFENENDISPSDISDIPTTVDPSTVTGHETITVPAGTFNCDKTTATSTISGTTSVSSAWFNSNIPIIGLVKTETTSGGVLTSTTELTEYGG